MTPNIILSSDRIRLRLLKIEDSRDLVAAASDGELWNLPFTVVPSAETIDDYIHLALEGYQAGTVLPFVVEDIATGKIIGSTRFWKIDRKFKVRNWKYLVFEILAANIRKYGSKIFAS